MNVRSLGRLALGVVAAGLAAIGAVVFPFGVIAALCLGALVGIAGYALAAEVPEARHRGDPPALARARRLGVTVAIATLVLTGTIVVFGEATLPLVLMAGLVSGPWMFARLRPRLGGARAGRDGPGPSAGTDAPPPVRDLDALTTPALRAHWHHSYHALQRSPDHATHRALVEQRRRYLDEFERRDPAGMTRWLATETRPASSGPRCGGGAEPIVRRTTETRRPPPPTED